MYWLNYLDRNAIALAKLDNIEKDLSITPTRQYRGPTPEKLLKSLTNFNLSLIQSTQLVSPFSSSGMQKHSLVCT